MFVAFDLEATGLSLIDDRIIEVGAVRFDAAGEVLATFDQLVRADRPSAARARAVHRIDEGRLEQARPAPAVLPEFLAFLGDPAAVTLLAHNAAFDAGLLGAELVRMGIPLPDHTVTDTLAWARRSWPDRPSHKLDALAQAIGAAPADRHRALVDSEIVRQIFLALRAAGPDPFGRPPLAYSIYNPSLRAPTPRGWEPVAAAIGRESPVEITYAGGSRGPTPRTITPVRFEHRGGTAYLVATCHLDGKLKQFRLESVLRFDAVDPAAGAPAGRHETS